MTIIKNLSKDQIIKICIMIGAVIFLYASSKIPNTKSNDQNYVYENENRDKIISDFEKNSKINQKDDDIESKNDNNSGGINQSYLENTQELLKEFSTTDSLKIEDEILKLFKDKKVTEYQIKENSLVKKGDEYFLTVTDNTKNFTIKIKKVNDTFECTIA